MKGLRRKIAQIESEYRSGLTLQQIGTKYGVTREYIRQLLSGHGVPPKEGGQSVRCRRKRERISEAKDLKCRSKYGLCYAEYRALDPYIRRSFQYQKRTARCRGIAFHLTLHDWLGIWNASGKLAERGVHGPEYCMARINDDGAYAIGNVYVTTNSENCSEYARAKARGDRKPRQKISKGVYHAYPGLARGYVARCGVNVLGYFATPNEAIAARAAFDATQ